jgi:23S rRNA (adenine2030-N6)-methyltransferase
MLSYRHAFHAGNFADVLKHIVLIRILAYLAIKPKPFCCIDTHAGAGSYDLTSAFALKNREFDTGIGRLYARDDLPGVVREYVDLVKAFNGGGDLRRYPGSPFIERRWLRDRDRLMLFELHPSDYHALEAFVEGDSRIRVARADGFEGCIALMPPRERRGLVMIDPSYEIKSDYRHVVDVLVRAHRRFATGVYALWYPVIERRRVNAIERAIRSAGIGRVHLFELGVRADAGGAGMTASGMIVVNPPWTLASEIGGVLPYLADVLGQDGQGFYRSLSIARG